MGREFELKFAAKPEDLDILKGRFPNLTRISMETTYYDTPNGELGNLHWTLRRRMENGRSVCTLKTPAGGFGRNEWETECADIEAALERLCGLGAPRQLLALTANGIVESCGARFTRLAGIIETDGAALELALDEGVLLGGGKELPFTEVEVELKEGSEEAAIRFASQLAGSLGLKPEPRSKVARARALVSDK